METAPRARPLRLSIVEDDSRVRTALRRLVLSLGLHAKCYGSGEAFLGDLAETLPDCVILDLNLPGLSGSEVLDRLIKLGHAIPVIVMTGLDRVGLQEQCLAAGAVAYLIKPIGIVDLESALVNSIGSTPIR